VHGATEAHLELLTGDVADLTIDSRYNWGHFVVSPRSWSVRCRQNLLRAYYPQLLGIASVPLLQPTFDDDPHSRAWLCALLDNYRVLVVLTDHDQLGNFFGLFFVEDLKNRVFLKGDYD
jgi:hypothetical protein